jgi:hypothetical protein
MDDAGEQQIQFVLIDELPTVAVHHSGDLDCVFIAVALDLGRYWRHAETPLSFAARGTANDVDNL